MSVYIIYIYVHIHTLYTLYIYRRYKHMYIHSVIQAYKSVHNALKGAQGWTRRCAWWWKAHGRSKACVQETQVYCLDYKFTSKLRHFQRAIQSREWKWESSMGASALPAQTVLGSKEHWPPKIKENVRWWHFSWPGLRIEMSPIAPLHIRSFHWKGGHKLLDSNQVLELGSTAKGCLSGRGQAGSETALLETPPKD